MSAVLFARAGGGHSFGGYTGGGGGGGFGGSGSGFHLHGFGFPIFFGGGFGGGSVLVLVIIVGIIVMLGVGAARRRSQPLEPPMDDEGLTGLPAWPAPPGTTEPAADRVGEGLAAIRAHDPAFDQAGFLAGAERAFFLVQQAWTERKPELSRQVMADGVWAQHKAQIEGYLADGKRNVLDDLSVGSATITAATSDQSYDTVTVRFLAACADYDVDVASGRVVRGDRQVRQWREDWVFQRSAEATTRGDGGTLQRRCPNCGAPLETDLSGVCPYCRVAVMSGKYDWVLSRIEQVAGAFGSLTGG